MVQVLVLALAASPDLKASSMTFGFCATTGEVIITASSSSEGSSL